MRTISYGRQYLDDDDIAAVVSALHEDWLTVGPRVAAFEAALKGCCGSKHAIAVSSGTAALHVAMLAGGVTKKDRVLTSSITFLASANCAEFVGASADFADIDEKTCNITADALAQAWRDDVRAAVAVDFAGQPCDMPAIAALARARGALVVEDASHALGSQFSHKGQWYKTGGHPWADMTTFSFHPVKTITTGEGGAILTDDDRLAERCRMFRNHGMVRSPATDNGRQTVCSLSSNPCSLLSERGPWYYEMHELGYNYRITDFQCALGLSQLKKLDKFVKRRREIVDRYNVAFAGFRHVVTPSCNPNAVLPAWHLYVLQINFAALGKTRTQVMGELLDKGIGTQVHYIPVHLQPFYRGKYGFAPGKCPVAEAYYQRCLSLPLYPSMTAADVDRVITAVTRVLSA